MTVRELLGQRLVVGFHGITVPEDFIKFLQEYKIGNIILFERNVANDKQLGELTARLREVVLDATGRLPFICIDQEGGGTARLDKRSFPLPGAMAIAATADPENAYLAGRMTGERLREVGINFNLAPVMDVNCNPGNPIICERSYGDTPEQVSAYGIRMMKGLMEEKVLACLKHFPGHGDTDMDSHLTLPVVKKPVAELEAMELAPFRAAVKAGAPAVMSAHILFPELEKTQVPATMSPTILTDLLRGRMGFRGLILSDCLEMQAIQKFYGTANGCLAALKAGVDLALISHTKELAIETMELLEKAYDKDSEFRKNTLQSVERILQYKEEYLGIDPPLSSMTAVTPKPESMSPSKQPDTIKPESISPSKQPDTIKPESISPSKQIAAIKSSSYPLPRGHLTAEDLMLRSITLVSGVRPALGDNPPASGSLPALGDNPLFLGCNLFCATGVENTENKGRSFPIAMQEMLGGQALEYTPQSLAELLNDKDLGSSLRSLPEAPERSHMSQKNTLPDKNPESSLSSLLRGHSCLVVGIYHGDQWPAQLDLISLLATQSIPLIVISLKSPYELFGLPDGVASIAAWEYSEPCFAALSKVLSGEVQPCGKLPISRL